MYHASDKMGKLIAAEPQTLQIISRFDLPLGVGEKSVDEVCRENGIHTSTFLSVLNRQPNPDIHIPTLQVYLKNAHTYFLDFALPRIRQNLIEAISHTHSDHQIPMLIMQFFDRYVEEVRLHIQHENESIYSSHATDDMHIANKLTELKNLIIKYYPDSTPNTLLYSALHEIFEIEQELALHCAIEDEILLPAMKKAKQKETKPIDGASIESEELSEREKEVLIQLVNGLSNKEIADVLCISTHTVISHRKNISRKLNIHSTAGLTIYAIVNHIVDVPQIKQ